MGNEKNSQRNRSFCYCRSSSNNISNNVAFRSNRPNENNAQHSGIKHKIDNHTLSISTFCCAYNKNQRQQIRCLLPDIKMEHLYIRHVTHSRARIKLQYIIVLYLIQCTSLRVSCEYIAKQVENRLKLFAMQLNIALSCSTKCMCYVHHCEMKFM